jgi:hypothetical protein
MMPNSTVNSTPIQFTIEDRDNLRDTANAVREFLKSFEKHTETVEELKNRMASIEKWQYAMGMIAALIGAEIGWAIAMWKR